MSPGTRRRQTLLPLCWLCLWLALAATVAPLQAQQPARVEIVGTPSTPDMQLTQPAVTVIRADALARAGVLTAEQALRRLAANQTDKGLAQGVGELTGGLAEADLRGLGASQTLVLLNGRRLANHAYDGAVVDLSTLPLALIERIEVQRDGASALHGSGAVAGVINFILRRDLQGLELVASSDRPQRRGGAASSLSLSAGHGALDVQGWNIATTLALRQQAALAARDRAFSRSALRRGSDGTLLGFRGSAASFPGDLDGFDPTLAAGCAPPRSLPDGALADANTRCRYDLMPDLDLLPRNQQLSWLTQAVWAPAPGHTLRLEALHARNRSQPRQGPAPVSLFLPQDSPHWLAGRGAEVFDGLGLGGVANFITAPAGARQHSSRAVSQRLLIEATGTLASLDYSAALSSARSRVADRLLGGHVDLEQLQRGLIDGAINPFGDPDASGRAAWRGASLAGPLLAASGSTHSADLQLAHTLATLDGGALRLAAGAALGRERFAFALQPLAMRTADPGFDLAQDIQGQRRSSALWLQLQLPWSARFGAELAARIDRNSDSTPRPSSRLVLRWQPLQALQSLQVRASLGSSFRSPTLYETRQPLQLADSGESADDPLLCPDGTALPGLVAAQVCNIALRLRSGGPVALGKPAQTLRAEHARHAGIGLVLQATPRLRLGIDLWQLRQRERIDSLPLQAVLDDPARHAARLVRCSQLGSAERDALDNCLAGAGTDPIAYIDLPLQNLGRVRAQGIDLQVQWQSGATPWGRFDASLEGSQVLRHSVQTERGGPSTEQVGRFAIDVPVFRWQHVLQAGWSAGPWAASLSQRHRSGYQDQHPGQTPVRRVAAYGLLDASLTYTGWPDLSLSLGLNNLLDRQPPFSNQSETPQSNHDPRFTDPTGRSLWLRLAYTWP